MASRRADTTLGYAAGTSHAALTERLMTASPTEVLKFIRLADRQAGIAKDCGRPEREAHWRQAADAGRERLAEQQPKGET